MKKVLAWSMFVGGVLGAIASACHLIAKGEPQWVLQLSWAALWGEGLVMVLVAHGDASEKAQVNRKLDALLIAHGFDDLAGS